MLLTSVSNLDDLDAGDTAIGPAGEQELVLKTVDDALTKSAVVAGASILGDGTVVSTGAIVFAGAEIGGGCILGDQSCVRERVVIADDVVVGRGSLVENDTTIGSGTRIQAGAYVTAYSTLEEHVFIAPCVVTTNDNFMGRTERRKELMRGPTIRRGARIGGGAIICPGLEIGEESFVGAGAVVTKDVPPRKLVVGNPARVLRDVADDELLENQ